MGIFGRLNGRTPTIEDDDSADIPQLYGTALTDKEDLWSRSGGAPAETCFNLAFAEAFMFLTGQPVKRI